MNFARPGDALVAGGSEAAVVGVGDQDRGGVRALHPDRSPIGGGIVHEDGFPSAAGGTMRDRIEAFREKGQGIEGDDDDAKVRGGAERT